MDYSESLAMISMLILIPVIIFAIAIVIVEIIGRWKLFKKAGRNGWESIVPFYSNWVYVEIAGLNWWYFLLVSANALTYVVEELQFLTYPASIIGLFFCNYNISKKLHKDTAFAVLMTLFPFVMLPLIGFSKSYVWDNSVSVGVNGPINSGDASNNNSSGNNYSDSMNKQDAEEKVDNQNSTSNYCSYCGNKLDSNSKFCGNCGKEI